MSALGAADIEELHRFAVDQPETYYATLIELLGLEFSKPPVRFLDSTDGKPFPRWFVGGEINVVDTCVIGSGSGPQAAKTAVVTYDESGGRRELKYRQLYEQVRALAGYLTHIGVGCGDAIGLYLPMLPEATVALFACAWVGAVAIPAFSGYGPHPLQARLLSCDAKLLITGGTFQRRGRAIDMAAVAHAAVRELPTVEQVICLEDSGSYLAPKRWVSWDKAMEIGRSHETEPHPVDPNHPLMVVYTSGTTGQPKGVVHSHAGFLVKSTSDFALAFDIHDVDRVLWPTDIGWLVGPMMIVANAALRSTAVYVVGAPDYPDLDQLWRLCESEAVTVLGLAPTLVRGMAAAESTTASGPRAHNLSSIRAFLSTGEPWDQASWRWLFEQAGSTTRPILNYTGGTEVGGGILTCYAALPVKECAFNGPVIGVDADVAYRDEQSKAAGQPGELVVRNTWPGMTHSFLHDADRYLETYWSAIPDLWVHGDLVVTDEDDYWFVLGRSDDTMKLAGRRVGPGEIESVLLERGDVVDAAAIGVPDPSKGERLVCFVVTPGPQPPNEAALKDFMGERLGRSLVPSRIEVVDALPKTKSGKTMRRAIRARYTASELGDLSSLDSLEALEAIPVFEPQERPSPQ
jgi:acetyl-CoA synthetase